MKKTEKERPQAVLPVENLMIMRNLFATSLFSALLAFAAFPAEAQTASAENYLDSLRAELNAGWPHNRTVNLVFHGHSVPSGYFATPQVRTLDAYPHRVLEIVKKQYPYAVVNSIVTGIGGENSEQGEKRFDREVLAHRPDVLFIDYALNDRAIGLGRAERAWRKMIGRAGRRKIPVVLCTPTPDLASDLLDSLTPLAQHARQIRKLAAEYRVGLADNYAAFVALAREGRDIRRMMAQSNHPNERGHVVAAMEIARWILTPEQRRAYEAGEVLGIMRRVADWQLDNFERQSIEGSRHPGSHDYRSWVNAVLYVGLAEMTDVVPDVGYRTFLRTVGRKMQWQPGRNIFFADDLCVGQFYAMAYERCRDSVVIRPTIEALGRIMAAPDTASLNYYAPGSHSRWCWCDALFMAPTVYARIGRLTGDNRYYDYLDREFRVACDTLYCPQERLFFRDTRYIGMREKNGERVFWGRGNGWVAAALTVLIDNMPDDRPSKARYVALFRAMMERIAGLQGPDGYWHASLLDPASYRAPETSATGFFTYSLLWGINRGLLDGERYENAAAKGWRALCEAVRSDGMVGYVQPIGADPQQVDGDDTEVYGVGAFLLAGRQMYDYLMKR